MARIRDWLIDKETGDLVIRNGDFATVEDTATDPAAVAQALRLRLRFFLGEWFLDEEIGVPWFQSILVKGPRLVEVREFLRAEILATPDVTELLSMTMNYDNATRKLSVAYKVRTNAGLIVEDTL